MSPLLYPVQCVRQSDNVVMSKGSLGKLLQCQKIHIQENCPFNHFSDLKISRVTTNFLCPSRRTRKGGIEIQLFIIWYGRIQYDNQGKIFCVSHLLLKHCAWFYYKQSGFKINFSIFSILFQCSKHWKKLNRTCVLILTMWDVLTLLFPHPCVPPCLAVWVPGASVKWQGRAVPVLAP